MVPVSSNRRVDVIDGSPPYSGQGPEQQYRRNDADRGFATAAETEGAPAGPRSTRLQPASRGDVPGASERTCISSESRVAGTPSEAIPSSARSSPDHADATAICRRLLSIRWS